VCILHDYRQSGALRRRRSAPESSGPAAPVFMGGRGGARPERGGINRPVGGLSSLYELSFALLFAEIEERLNEDMPVCIFFSLTLP
jgi:hypothetical protein